MVRTKQLKALQELTLRQFQALALELPELEHRGLTLFLGKHYAVESPRVMMLGINPGGEGDHPVHLDLCPSNWLVGDPADGEAKAYRYWRNARRCFSATTELQDTMNGATFGFCSPFRTPVWSGLPAVMRRAIREHSGPILRQMLTDCRPTSVIVAGRVSVDLLAQIGGIPLSPQLNPAGQAGRHSWSIFRGAGPWGQFDVLQVPHFSRFNSRAGLQECGEWLAGQLGCS